MLYSSVSSIAPAAHSPIRARSTRGAGVHRPRARREAGQAGALAHRILKGEHRLDEGREARPARRLELVDQPVERHILVGEGFEGRALDLLEERAEARVLRKVAPQGQRVDEQADERLGLAQVPAGRRNADDQIGLLRAPRQQHLERGEQGHEQRGALAPAEFDKRLAERGGHRVAQGGAANVELVGTGPVGRELQLGGSPASFRRQYSS